jgi:hypothetical protein
MTRRGLLTVPLMMRRLIASYYVGRLNRLAGERGSTWDDFFAAGKALCRLSHAEIFGVRELPCQNA